MAHTPSPWKINERFSEPRFLADIEPPSDDYMTIAHSIRTEADARLIAAAPDLLEACVAAYFAGSDEHARQSAHIQLGSAIQAANPYLLATYRKG